MADAQALKCPSCGAPLPISNRFVRMVACQYCSSTCEITDEGLNIAGQSAKLIPLPTRFAVGQSGTLRGRAFQILGRVRYAHEDGQWDEWFLEMDDGSPAWLEEDEGEIVLSRVERLRTPVPPFDQIRVGTQLQVNGHNFFVTERCRARIAGAEGQLYFRAVPGRPVQFVDGNLGGRIGFLEFTDDAIEFGLGEPVERRDIKVEGA